jgi:hypothetical protein
LFPDVANEKGGPEAAFDFCDVVFLPPVSRQAAAGA